MPDILTIAIIIAAICGIVWAYPKLPHPGGMILVIAVAVGCLLVLLKYAGLL